MNFAELADPEFWARWFAIVVLDLTLAGDNALVIALAVRNLPARQQWQGRIWGTVGAVALRILFIGIISFLLGIPFLQAVGGLLLLWIAVKLLSQEAEGHGEGVRHGTSLFEAIWIIIVADVIMSLDNVIAIAAAAGGNMALLVIGLGISIPLIIAGAALIMSLLDRFPILVWAGAALLGWIVGEVIATDPVIANYLTSQHGAVTAHRVEIGAAAVGAALVLLVGGLWRRSRLRSKLHAESET